MKSEFYWGFLSSLIIALSVLVYQYIQNKNQFPDLGKENIANFMAPGLFPFVGIYFIVGVIMLFNKKSESFAKGLLLSALILFLAIIISYQGWI